MRVSSRFVPVPSTPYGFSVNSESVTAENTETTLPDGMTYDIATNKLTATKDITGDLTIKVTDTALKLDVSLQSVTGDVTLPEGVEMVLPGDNVSGLKVKLIQKVAIEDGSEFAIREGGLTVGAGRITKIIA